MDKPTKDSKRLYELEQEIINSQDVEVDSERCRVINPIKCELMLRRVAKMSDAKTALDAIKEYFVSELGAAVTNAPVSQIMGVQSKVLVNTTNEHLLFPHLQAMCLMMAKDKGFSDTAQTTIKRYLGTFMSEWSVNMVTPAKRQTKPQNSDNCKLTEREVKYYQIAIEKGFMKRDGDGYKWTYGDNRGVIRLAYFLKKIFNQDGYGITPFKKLEQLFGVSRLDSATNRINETKKKQSWREKIDVLFQD